MILKKAEVIRDLLNLRDELVSQLNDLMDCKSIRGDICFGKNGRGINWSRDSWQVKCLIEGINQEIKKVEEKILEF